MPLEFYKDRYNRLKKKSMSSEEKAWMTFAYYIKMRDCNDLLLGKCFTCDWGGFYLDFDCGHYIDRRMKSTMFDEMNNHIQCKHCNRVLDGNTEVYRQRLVDRYGEKAVLELEEKSRTLERPLYAEINNGYREAIYKMERDKFKHLFFPERMFVYEKGKRGYKETVIIWDLEWDFAKKHILERMKNKNKKS